MANYILRLYNHFTYEINVYQYSSPFTFFKIKTMPNLFVTFFIRLHSCMCVSASYLVRGVQPQTSKSSEEKKHQQSNKVMEAMLLRYEKVNV